MSRLEKRESAWHWDSVVQYLLWCFSFFINGGCDGRRTSSLKSVNVNGGRYCCCCCCFRPSSNAPPPCLSFHQVICHSVQVTQLRFIIFTGLFRPQKKSATCLTRGATPQILMSLRRGWGGGLVYRQPLGFVGRYKILMVVMWVWAEQNNHILHLLFQRGPCSLYSARKSNRIIESLPFDPRPHWGKDGRQCFYFTAILCVSNRIESPVTFSFSIDFYSYPGPENRVIEYTKREKKETIECSQVKRYPLIFQILFFLSPSLEHLFCSCESFDCRSHTAPPLGCPLWNDKKRKGKCWTSPRTITANACTTLAAALRCLIKSLSYANEEADWQLNRTSENKNCLVKDQLVTGAAIPWIQSFLWTSYNMYSNFALRHQL